MDVRYAEQTVCGNIGWITAGEKICYLTESRSNEQSAGVPTGDLWKIFRALLSMALEQNTALHLKQLFNGVNILLQVLVMIFEWFYWSERLWWQSYLLHILNCPMMMHCIVEKVESILTLSLEKSHCINALNLLKWGWVILHQSNRLKWFHQKNLCSYRSSQPRVRRRHVLCFWSNSLINPFIWLVFVL